LRFVIPQSFSIPQQAQFRTKFSFHKRAKFRLSEIQQSSK